MIHGIAVMKYLYTTGKGSVDMWSDFFNTILLLCGYVTAIAAAVAALYKAYKHFKKPNENFDQQLEKHDQEIKRLKEKANNDYEAINEIKDMQSLLCQAMIAMIDNRITGNNVEGLKKTKNDMIKYLADSK